MVIGSPAEDGVPEVKSGCLKCACLRYYSLEDEVTMQCDASKSGLGAALIQLRQPVAFATRALIPAETRYTQMEKELLATVYTCEKFDVYMYGRTEVTIQSYHKSLGCIFKKPLNPAPTRLQRMLLRLQRYNPRIVYTKGTEIVIADTQRRAYLPVNMCHLRPSLEEIDATLGLLVNADRLQQIQHATLEDPVLPLLSDVIKAGWPNDKCSVPPAVLPYWDARDEFVIDSLLIFKGHRLVIPVCLRSELMAVTHASHIGIEGCLRRARECLFWPHMSQDLKKFISTCDVCQTHQHSQQKEPLQQHKEIMRPRAKLGVDLCQLHGHTRLVVCNYFSYYIEVERLTTTTSRSAIITFF